MWRIEGGLWGLMKWGFYVEKEVEKQEPIMKDDIHITYYFTVICTIVGTLITLYLLSYKVEKLSIFIVFLSISAGGLPIGIVGAFIDYKISQYKVKYNKTVWCLDV